MPTNNSNIEKEKYYQREIKFGANTAAVDAHTGVTTHVFFKSRLAEWRLLYGQYNSVYLLFFFNFSGVYHQKNKKIK